MVLLRSGDGLGYGRVSGVLGYDVAYKVNTRSSKACWDMQRSKEKASK